MNNDFVAPTATPHSASLESLTTPPCRILLVDDDSGIRQFSSEALIRSGYRVDAAEDGAVAWEALQAGNFHLLITDNNMPRLTGVELVRKVRSARMAMPVIMATGRPPTEALDGTPPLELAAMLPKPFSLDELLKTVRRVLAESDSPRERMEPLQAWRTQPEARGLRL